MQLGPISLISGALTGAACLLAPMTAAAQPVIDTYVNFDWFGVAQEVCVERGAAAVNDAIATFDLDGATTRQDEWYVLGDANDPVFWVFCIADDETTAIVAPNAKRILVNVSVSGTDGALAERIRDHLIACMEGECPVILPATAETITWNTNAANYRGQNGALIDFVCPPLAPGEAVGVVWGTDIYTDDSSICQAAAHAGVIERASGGPVTIEILPGEASYRGSFRNGIKTESYTSFGGSFRVVIGG